VFLMVCKVKIRSFMYLIEHHSIKAYVGVESQLHCKSLNVKAARDKFLKVTFKRKVGKKKINLTA
jgi:hypothetical protein